MNDSQIEDARRFAQNLKEYYQREPKRRSGLKIKRLQSEIRTLKATLRKISRRHDLGPDSEPCLCEGHILARKLF